MLHLLAAIEVGDAANIGTGVGVGALILATVKIVVSVTAERARVCEADRVRCEERLDAKDVIVSNLTNEVSRLQSKMDEGRTRDEDVRRYLDGQFTDVHRALAELRGN